jgi:formylmethanofuran dehydrogenase subunit B
VANVVCPVCCCLCDNLRVAVADNRVVDVQNACERGRNWFLGRRDEVGAPVTVNGESAPLDRAIAAAADILASASYPLVYVLNEMSSEAQQRAIAIADWLGAVVDTATSSGHAPSIMAVQHAGKVTCTLGETRNRANLIIFWGTNVVAKYPRFFTHYSADARGKFVPRGRADRTVIAIDTVETETTRAVDRAMLIPPNSDFEVLNVLRSLVRGVSIDAREAERQTGHSLAVWRALAEAMKQAQFGSIVFGGGLMHTRGRHANCEALFRLVAELNDHTRFVCRSIRLPGNVTGGDKTMAWLTGYPFAVDLSRGFPRYGPGEFTAEEMLARGEPDAALVVGGSPGDFLSESALVHLRSIPTVHVASRLEPLLRDSAIHRGGSKQVAIQTATHGFHTAGTMYRMDDVPLRTRAVVRSPLPSECDVLTLLEQRVRAD